MILLWQGLRDLGQMFGDGLRLLLRHWPSLLAYYLAGAAGRMGFLWLALWVSQFNSLLGILLMPLAPLCTLLSLVFMLRVIGESLPAFGNLFSENTFSERLKSNLKVAAVVLIPFLAVYSSQGLLKEDITLFVYDASADEAINNALSPNYARLLIASGWTMGIIVVMGMLARKLIATYELSKRSLGWGAIGSYVEALWMVTLSATFASQLSQGKEWISSRAIVDGVSQWWSGLMAAPGVVGQVLSGLTHWLTSTLGSMGELMVVPVAWLAIGASVYGSKFTGKELPSHERMTRQINRIPNPVRRTVAHLIEPVTTPVRDTAKAIGKVAAAGIIPMVLFCVAFSLMGTLIKIGVAWLARWLVGPQDALWQTAINPYITLAERGAYLMLTIVLVAAAVNRIVLSEREQQAAEGEAKAQEQEPAVSPA